MYKIKQTPEDFIVRELMSLNTSVDGKFFYHRLEKRNLTTLDAIRRLSTRLTMPLKSIGFAGNKDKVAVTEQFISLKQREVDSLIMKDLSLSFISRGDDPITLGTNTGNSFIIVVRNVSEKPILQEEFINYFGDQRFSTHNVAIGRDLVKKEYGNALMLLKESDSVETIHPTNLVGSLQTVNPKLLRFFIHAFQSYLWNKIVKECVSRDIRPDVIPLIGFSTPETSEAVRKIIDDLLAEEGLTERDFINRQLPYLSVEGSSRKVFVHSTNLQLTELEEDDLNEGMKKVTLEFDLDSGCYATEYVKQLFL